MTNFKTVPVFHQVFIYIIVKLTVKHDILIKNIEYLQARRLNVFEICMCLIIFEIYKPYFKPLI